MIRRAKFRLDAIPTDVLARAFDAGELVAGVGLTDRNGNPACPDLRTTGIEWSVGLLAKSGISVHPGHGEPAKHDDQHLLSATML
jgi:hypothetical protein